MQHQGEYKPIAYRKSLMPQDAVKENYKKMRSTTTIVFIQVLVMNGLDDIREGLDWSLHQRTLFFKDKSVVPVIISRRNVESDEGYKQCRYDKQYRVAVSDEAGDNRITPPKLLKIKRLDILWCNCSFV